MILLLSVSRIKGNPSSRHRFGSIRSQQMLASNRLLALPQVAGSDVGSTTRCKCFCVYISFCVIEYFFLLNGLKYLTLYFLCEKGPTCFCAFLVLALFVSIYFLLDFFHFIGLSCFLILYLVPLYWITSNTHLGSRILCRFPFRCVFFTVITHYACPLGVFSNLSSVCLSDCPSASLCNVARQWRCSIGATGR